MVYLNHPREWTFGLLSTLALRSRASVKNLVCVSLYHCSIVSYAEFYENGISVSKMYMCVCLCVGVYNTHICIYSANLSFRKAGHYRPLPHRRSFIPPHSLFSLFCIYLFCFRLLLFPKKVGSRLLPTFWPGALDQGDKIPCTIILKPTQLIFMSFKLASWVVNLVRKIQVQFMIPLPR